jgi:hypothetical protein
MSLFSFLNSAPGTLDPRGENVWDGTAWIPRAQYSGAVLPQAQAPGVQFLDWVKSITPSATVPASRIDDPRFAQQATGGMVTVPPITSSLAMQPVYRGPKSPGAQGRKKAKTPAATPQPSVNPFDELTGTPWPAPVATPVKSQQEGYTKGTMQSRGSGPTDTAQAAPANAGPTENDIRLELGNKFLELAGRSNVRPAYNPSFADMQRASLERQALEPALLARNGVPVQERAPTMEELELRNSMKDLHYQNQAPLTQTQATKYVNRQKRNLGEGTDKQMAFIEELAGIGRSIGVPLHDPAVMDIWLTRQGRRRPPTTEANRPMVKVREATPVPSVAEREIALRRSRA